MVIQIEKHIYPVTPHTKHPFRRLFEHQIPSVFHADQCGGCTFLIWTLWLEFWHHPRPHGDPQHQQSQGLILELISLNINC